MKHVHLIGIGGTGLSAIARVLLERGYTVSGSDRTESPLLKAITVAGARTFLGHDAKQVSGADLVIRSSAIPEDNPEVVAAKAAGIPVIHRAEFLAELTAGQDTLAVAGSHGKTTTTAMLIWILVRLGTDPSFISGGMVNQLMCNARAGAGQYFVIEADEYDNMFLGLTPKIAIVTNIEHDHTDCFPTEANYRAAFMRFMQKVTPDGLALVCMDEPGAWSLAQEMAQNRRILGYGFDPAADFHAVNLSYPDGSPHFNVIFNGEELGTVQLSVPGRHNVLNATAALAVVHQLGLDLPKAIEVLSTFTGAGRRFEEVGQARGVRVIDDYGHHPTEIAATLEATRSRFSESRIWAVWQPHTFTRTQSLAPQFIQAFAQADQVVTLKIYAAREADSGYSAESICKALPMGTAHYFEDFHLAASFLLEALLPGDVMIVFSAGDATDLSRMVLDGLRESATQEGNR